MSKQVYYLLLCSILFGFVMGCSERKSVPLPATTSETTAVTGTSGGSNGSSESTASESSASESVVIEKPAAPGVTHRSDFEDSAEVPMSIITVPLATYFKAEEMAVFNIQIPHTMSLYQATTGEYPKTEEEFMTNIIEQNQIVLPKLRSGDSYVYDVPTHTLMVRTVSR